MSKYATFKQAEREVCKRLGIERTGYLGGADGSGDWLAVEVKHRKTLPTWLHDAMAQAERHAQDGQLPIVALHELRQPYAEAFVVMRLDAFVEWFGDSPQPQNEVLDELAERARNGDGQARDMLAVLAPDRHFST